MGVAGMSALSLVILPLTLVYLPADDEAALESAGALMFALILIGFGLLQILLYLATVVVFLMWLYRAYGNLPVFGNPVSSLSYSPGWAVGSFFVPFVNLVVPYRAVRELWQKSERFGITLSSQSPPAFFPLWWGFWIVANVVNNFSFRLEFSGDVTQETGVIVGLIGDALNIIAAIFAATVVGDIDRRQEATKAALELSTPGPPLPPATFDDLPQPQPYPTA